jgi:hypothetical protein
MNVDQDNHVSSIHPPSDKCSAHLSVRRVANTPREAVEARPNAGRLLLRNAGIVEFYNSAGVHIAFRDRSRTHSDGT